LADNISSSRLVVSLFDFAGDEIFSSLHPFFITRNGIFIVVFNTLEILDDNTAMKSLSSISHWMNTVATYAFMPKCGSTDTRIPVDRMPRIALVGTHLDEVERLYPDTLERLRRLSSVTKLIEDVFSKAWFWSLILKNFDSPSPCFFVDSTKGSKNPSVRRLMTAIEEAVENSWYCQQKYPLSWFKAIDALLSSQCNVVSFEEAKAKCLESGVVDSSVHLFLETVNELGLFMWHNVPGLRGVVILDGINFFVEPATRIICDIRSHDPAIYSTDPDIKTIISACYDRFGNDWRNLYTSGVASLGVVRALLQPRRSDRTPGDQDVLIRLMIKYGLAIEWKPLQQRQLPASSNPQALEALLEPQYVFPALFRYRNCAESVDWTQSSARPLFLVFALNDFQEKVTLQPGDMAQSCFMHGGIYDKFITAVLDRSQLTPNIGFGTFEITGLYAELQLANVRFRMRSLLSMNCIQVDVPDIGLMPIILRRLMIMWDAIANELGNHLRMHPCVEIPQPTSSVSVWRSNGHFLLIKNYAVARLQGKADLLLREVDGHESNDQMTLFLGSLEPLLALPIISEVKSKLKQYDLFISYRWDTILNRHPLYKSDMDRVDDLCDQLHDYSVHGSSMSIFLDRETIGTGDEFRRIFIASLVTTAVMVPILSPVALERMITLTAERVDNLLMEWLAGQIFVKFWPLLKYRSSALHIFPVIFTDRDAHGEFRDFDTSKLSDDIRPTATIEKLIELLEEIGCSNLNSEALQRWLSKLTVRKIVAGLLDFICHKIESDYSEDCKTNESRLLGLVAREIFMKVQQCVEEPNGCLVENLCSRNLAVQEADATNNPNMRVWNSGSAASTSISSSVSNNVLIVDYDEDHFGTETVKKHPLCNSTDDSNSREKEDSSPKRSRVTEEK
jgi:hypothetical protein